MTESRGFPLDDLFDSGARLARLLDDFEVLGDLAFMVLIPSDTPEGLRQNIIAAAKAYNLGLKSMDYALKRYGPWSRDSSEAPSEAYVKDMLDKATNEVDQSIRNFSSIKDKPGDIGPVAAGGALVRLQASFRAVSLLIRLGYTFESLGILRLILEQVAWAYAVHDFKDKDNVWATVPTKSISRLKDLLPWVGSIYGILSNFAHISPHLTTQYIEAYEGDYRVTLTSPQNSLFLSFISLTLADIFGTVAEYVYRKSVPIGRYLEKGNQLEEYEVKQSRPLTDDLRNYRSILRSHE